MGDMANHTKGELIKQKNRVTWGPRRWAQERGESMTNQVRIEGLKGRGNRTYVAGVGNQERN